MTVTVDELRDELAVTPDALGLTEADYTALLDRLITRETERLEAALGVSFTQVTTSTSTARPAHIDDRVLPLPATPVRDVTAIEIDTDRAYGENVAPSDVDVAETHLRLRRDAPRDAWPTAARSVSVTWAHGYAETETPPVVDGAVIGLVRQAVQEIEADGIDQEAIAGDNMSYQLPEKVVKRHVSRAREYAAPTYSSGIQVI